MKKVFTILLVFVAITMLAFVLVRPVSDNENSLYRSAEGERAVSDYYAMMLDDWPIPSREHRN